MWGTGIFAGLAVSMRNMRRGAITLQYPFEKAKLPPRARWALRHKRDSAGVPKCTACRICERECPDGIIAINFHATEDGGKHIDSYVYEIGACMFCGLCVESCPFDAIEMSHTYELAVTTRRFFRTLLKDVPAASPKAKPRATAGDAAATGGGADA